MPTPFNFASDESLPASLAAKMQAVADHRAASGLISEDGQTHRNSEAKAVYDSGLSVLSKAYLDASFPQ